MKRFAAIIFAAVLLMSFGASALADGEGAVVQSSCNIVKSGDYYLVYCYAQVRNQSDSIICLDKGTFQLSNGEQLLYVGEVAQLWPYFIAPGEEGYLFDIASFEPNEDGVVVPNVTGLHYDLKYMTIDTAYAGQNLDVSARIDRHANGMSVVCQVNNPSLTDAYDATIAFGLYTESGALIYADGQTLKDVGIPAGGSVYVKFDVDEIFVRQWSAYQAEPAQIRATAMFRNSDD